MGIRFATRARLGIQHFGLYWETIRADFSNIEEHAPLPQASDPAGRPRVELLTGPPPLPRCWFVDKSKSRLIQLQGDRLIHNWRKVTGSEPYPRYEAIRDEFLRRWKEFVGFAEEHAIGTPKITLCELIYVNHILRESPCIRPEDIPPLFSFFADSGKWMGGCALESVSTDIRLRLPRELGQLCVSLRPMIRTADNKEILQFTLSAQGAPKNGGIEEIGEWFDAAREFVVRSFANLTTQIAHHAWKRRV
jgi:uncharacterized protein (TIGR04255 family)